MQDLLSTGQNTGLRGRGRAINCAGGGGVGKGIMQE
jgi:hypothetical protein